jgi:hypothetical protein
MDGPDGSARCFSMVAVQGAFRTQGSPSIWKYCPGDEWQPQAVATSQIESPQSFAAHRWKWN